MKPFIAFGRPARERTRKRPDDTQQIHAGEPCSIEDFHYNASGNRSKPAAILFIIFTFVFVMFLMEFTAVTHLTAQFVFIVVHF